MGKDISFQLILRRRRSSLARPEVQTIFEKYVSGVTRRLGKDEGLDMLVKEYDIDKKWAEQFFDHFDSDNTKVFTLWKFQHFNTVVGKKAPTIVSQFCELDTNGDQCIEREDLRTEISKMKTTNGEELSEKEIDFFMKGVAGEKDEKINIGQYADVLYRIQIYKKPPKRN